MTQRPMSWRRRVKVAREEGQPELMRAKALFAAAVLNFFTFLWVGWPLALRSGEEIPPGKVEGRVVLVQKGKTFEVSLPVYVYARVHGYGSILFLLGSSVLLVVRRATSGTDERVRSCLGVIVTLALAAGPVGCSGVRHPGKFAPSNVDELALDVPDIPERDDLREAVRLVLAAHARCDFPAEVRARLPFWRR